MAWIEVHQSLPTHRKTLALADALGIKPVQAMGHLVCVWLWTLDNAPDGDLSGVAPKTIARAAQWTRKPELFIEALVESGFMDISNQIHDWPDYTWRLLTGRDENRNRNRERQQRWRDKHRDSNALRVTEDNATVTVMDNGEGVTNNRAPYRTVPNRTVPNPTAPGSAGASPGGSGGFRPLGSLLPKRGYVPP